MVFIPLNDHEAALGLPTECREDAVALVLGVRRPVILDLCTGFKKGGTGSC